MRAWSLFVLPALATVALYGAPALGQNGGLTPFSTSQQPTFSPVGSSGGGHSGGGGNGGGNSGGGSHHHGNNVPALVFPWTMGEFDDLQTPEIQSQPVNTAPFAPTLSGSAPGNPPAQPYKPPTVEVAPGGIEIVRGPSS
jgi:hypothetical protein